MSKRRQKLGGWLKNTGLQLSSKLFDKALSATEQAIKGTESLLISRIRNQLQSPESSKRKKAISKLVSSNHPEVYPLLLKGLDDPEIDVVWQALCVVEKLPSHPPEFHHPLLELFFPRFSQHIWKQLEQLSSHQKHRALQLALHILKEDIEEQTMSYNPSGRERHDGAVEVLIRLSPPGVLAEFLQSPELETCMAFEHIDKLLCFLGPKEPDVLLQTAQRLNGWAHEKILEALQYLPVEKSLPIWFTAFESPQPELRARAQHLLSNCPEALPKLLEYLHHKNPELQSFAVYTLELLRSPKAVKRLCECLPESKEPLRNRILVALSQIASPEAIPALRETFEQSEGDDRLFVGYARAHCGDLEVSPYLREILTMLDTPELLSESNLQGVSSASDSQRQQFKNIILKLLGKLSCDENQEFLYQRLQQEIRDYGDDISFDTLEAVISQKDHRIVPILNDWAGKVDRYLEHIIAAALQDFAHPEGLPGLLDGLHNLDDHARSKSIQTIEQLGMSSPEVMDALKRFLHTEVEKELQIQVWFALVQLGEEDVHYLQLWDPLLQWLFSSCGHLCSVSYFSLQQRSSSNQPQNLSLKLAKLHTHLAGHLIGQQELYPGIQQEIEMWFQDHQDLYHDTITALRQFLKILPNTHTQNKDYKELLDKVVQFQTLTSRDLLQAWQSQMEDNLFN